MAESVRETLDRINKLYEARVKVAFIAAKGEEERLRCELAERQKIETELEAKTKDRDKRTAEYLKIKETTEAKGFNKLPAQVKKKHRLRLQSRMAAVREADRTCLALGSMIAELDAGIERIRLAFFAIWHQVAKTTLNDYERARTGKARLHELADLAIRKDAECRVSEGGYPFYIKLEVHTKDALTLLPLDSRFLDKHLPDVHGIISEYRDMDFDRHFLQIRYLSITGLQPEGVILTIKNKPLQTVGHFRESSTPEIESKE